MICERAERALLPRTFRAPVFGARPEPEGGSHRDLGCLVRKEGADGAPPEAEGRAEAQAEGRAGKKPPYKRIFAVIREFWRWLNGR